MRQLLHRYIALPGLCVILLFCSGTVRASETQKLLSVELQKIVTEQIASRAAESGVQAIVKRFSPIPDVTLSAGRIEYEVLSPAQWEGWGRASLSLLIRLDGRLVRNIPVHCDVEGWRDVLVAAHPLERGTVLERKDLETEKRDISPLTGQRLPVLDDVVGMKLKVSVRKGKILLPRDLEKFMVVKAGQMVTIIAENDVLRLTATGKTRTAGAVGDQILVLNSASNRELTARVLDGSTVRVEF